MWTNIRSQFGDFTNSTNFVKDKKQNEKKLNQNAVCCYTFHSFWKLHSSYRESYRFWYEKNSWFWVDYNLIFYRQIYERKETIYLPICVTAIWFQLSRVFILMQLTCTRFSSAMVSYTYTYTSLNIIPVLFSKSESIKST